MDINTTNNDMPVSEGAEEATPAVEGEEATSEEATSEEVSM